LPARYREVTKRFGVAGAIEVEWCTWLEDNQWVLDVAEKDTIMVGTVGDLEPGKPEFPKQLEWFHKNPLFRGIRYGNLWGRNLGAELEKPRFVADLKLRADAGLVLDTANPNPRLLADVVRLTDLVPGLRVVIDHLPSLRLPQIRMLAPPTDATLKELGKRLQVYIKVSEVLRRAAGVKVTYDLATYRSTLDEIHETFGPDRLLFGSDWPDCDPLGTY
jgi:predicted TIM-barrel fold metal-dependent hydrolase